MWDRLVTVIAETMKVSADTITRDTLLTDDLGVDSLSMYRILLALEEAFDADIRIDAAEVRMRTVGDLFDHVKKDLSEFFG